MRNSFKYYTAMWVVLGIIYNVMAFMVPHAYTASFWIGYWLIMIALLGQLFCAYQVFQEKNVQKVFYHIPLITISTRGLLISFVAGSLCMVIKFFPYWISAVICVLVLGSIVMALLRAKIAADAVSDMDQRIKEQIFFIKSLTAEANNLTMRAVSEADKAACKKVYEAIRYSDPMSSESLSSVEAEITQAFQQFEAAVVSSEKETKEIAAVLLRLVAERNEQCKLLK